MVVNIDLSVKYSYIEIILIFNDSHIVNAVGFHSRTYYNDLLGAFV